MKIGKIIQLKLVIFTAVKNHCMLHGRVFVMCCQLKKNFVLPSLQKMLLEADYFMISQLTSC